MSVEAVMTTRLETMGRDLLDILQQQDSHHKSLLELILRKREAIRVADFSVIAPLCLEERKVARAVTELEQQRLTLVAQLTKFLAPQADASLRISDIAKSMEPQLGEELIEQSEILREHLREVHRESSIVRRAADALAKHMTGIMQVVQTTLTEAPVYGRQGRMAVNAHLDSAIDMKS